MLTLDLILNLSLLVSLSIISGFIENRWSRQTRQGQLLQGLLFGLVAVIGMLRPLDLAPGLLIDGRSIMVSLCAFFFGPWAALAAVVPTTVCRIGLGGAGMIVGVLIVLSSAAIGLLAHSRFNPNSHPPSMGRLYLFGLVVHLMMLVLMFFLPESLDMLVLKNIGLPVLLFYPLATILAGKILADQTIAIRNLLELQESEDLFRSLFDDHLAVKWILDPDSGRIIDANQAAAAYYGWSQEELRRMKIQEINTLPPEEIQQQIALVKAGKKNQFEFRHRRADGSIRDVAVFSSKIMIKGRTLLHSIIHDITEQKQGEKRLREQEERYRALVDNAPIGIFTITSKGETLMMNQAMADFLECASPQQAIHYYTDIGNMLWVFPDEHLRYVKMLWEQGQVENFEFQARTLLGKPIWLDVCARMADKMEDGSFIIEGFASDITDRHKLEEQFLHAQKMESVGRLAGGVAHDFNNMLAVILGYSEIGLTKVDPASPLSLYLQEISNAGHRARQVTQQLLAFARRQAIAPKVLDLNITIEEMLKMLHRLIGEDIDLAWKPAPDLWPVKIDPSQVDQILVNLCVNARDAIADVGKITIETQNVVFDQLYCEDHLEFIPGEFVRLAVSDTGRGIDKEILNKIFEPFFTTKGLGSGTGLGLATVYGIVKQNGGFVNVYSEPGKGTSFHIYLLRNTEQQEIDGSPSEKGEILFGHGETILVVEDEAVILQLAQVILEGLGYRVLTAGTPAEALRLAEEHGSELHLLLTDVVMPGCNGKELADRLCFLHPTLKYLFMSGYTANVIAHRGILEDGVHFIQKPFSREQLAKKVREAME
ncbi:MAG: multi-sensor hybrid histidine [Desulfobulbaceae bacterium]|nr:MAG: multi-sensor hybrid histidine [Desulfobulbaceae bacterium]